MRFYRPSKIQQLLFPKFQWKVVTNEKTIYLTFDDGPTEEVTDYVLDLLDQYDAKATFFLIGEKIMAGSELIRRIVRSGHSIGNHSFSHPSGWSMATLDYMDEIERCDKELAIHGVSTELFRPPYGRITFAQYKNLLKKKRVVMWSLLSWDFDEKLEIDNSLNILKKTVSGDILVFHDSQKAFSNLKKILPEILEYFSTQGFQFKKL